MTRLTTIVIAIVASVTCPVASLAAAPSPVDYQRQISPLLAEHCLECHGASEADREGDLRLDVRNWALRELPSGATAIAPGQPAQSELVQRVTSTDPAQRMPPPEHGRALTATEVDLLRRWIATGAEAPEHWSLVPPQKSALPSVSQRSWPHNPIDRFIAARFEAQGISPAPPTSREALARRAALVLTGLPPTVEQLREFLHDQSPAAYQRYLDRLFASPAYGEQMATAWLDLARYADTHGFHTDSHREMWRWRDQVIAAYHSHQPLDQFITEQLAGDLLPQATLDQQIASGFNRNHMINFENGALPTEYRNLYVVDRVNTTAAVFLGLTMSCAQCHDHKYDPLSQQEYYSLYAFFNNVPEQGLDGKQGNAVPLVRAPTAGQQRELTALAREIDVARETMSRRVDRAAELTAAWEKLQEGKSGGELLRRGEKGEGRLAWQFSLDERGRGGGVAVDTVSERALGKVFGQPLFVPAGRFRGGLLLSAGAGIELQPPAKLKPAEGMTLSAWVYPTTNDPMRVLSLTENQRWELGLDRGRPFARVTQPEGTVVMYSANERIRSNSWSHLLFRYSGGEAAAGQFFLEGKPLKTTVDPSTGKPGTNARVPVRLTIGSPNRAISFKGMLDEVRGYDYALSAQEIAQLSEADPIAEIVKLSPSERTGKQQQRLQQHYLTQVDQAYRQAEQALRVATRRHNRLLKQAPTSMVMQELPEPRATHLLLRGDYRQLGPRVERATPAVLHDWPADAPRNRLGLARWLVDRANPLTARVFVNRHWQQIFRQPLVATPEDFGMRGKPPTHPQLLDWLAVELIESGWDLQHLQRLMLTSATFRQAGMSSAEHMAADPLNQYYARYGRRSLTAEQVRDSALLAAGLLDRRVGGESVFPYQPAGLWEAISYDPREFTAQTYAQSQGADLYRRSLYTFWKRSLPPPALAAFGAPTRELCTVERSTAVTAQQSLVIWNDPTYVEAARHIAQRVLPDEATDSSDDPLDRLYELMLSRQPAAAERQIVRELQQQQVAHFRADAAAAVELLSVGESACDENRDSAQLAAWTIVVQTLMMTDEFLSLP